MKKQQTKNNWQMLVVDKISDLPFYVDPPAIAYVLEVDDYYFKYHEDDDLKKTPYFSGINGWHNYSAPTPLNDRKIHIIRTQWLNGWNLDYFPDYIETMQKAREQDELEGIFGQHGGPSINQNTVITDLKPGEIIYRTQEWVGVTAQDHLAGDKMIAVVQEDNPDSGNEIADKCFSSRNIPAYPWTDPREGYDAETNAYMQIGDEYYPVIDHEPNTRSLLGYPEVEDSRFDHLWQGCGLKTTRVFLRSALRQPIPAGTEYKITVRTWYVVSVEHLGSTPGNTSWESPAFCEEYDRRNFDYFWIGGSRIIPRFERKIHHNQNTHAIPGDLIYRPATLDWHQVLPENKDHALFSCTVTVDEKAPTEGIPTTAYIVKLKGTQKAPLILPTSEVAEDGRVVTTLWDEYHRASFTKTRN